MDIRTWASSTHQEPSVGPPPLPALHTGELPLGISRERNKARAVTNSSVTVEEEKTANTRNSKSASNILLTAVDFKFGVFYLNFP